MSLKAKTVEKIVDDQLVVESLPIPKAADNKRSRFFSCTTYIDVNALERFLKTSPWVHHWAYCTHDKDVTDKGEIKVKHTHVLLYTYNGKTSSAILKLFDSYSLEIYKNTDIDPQNTLVEYGNNAVSLYRYLLHLDHPEKYQYAYSERFCDDVTFWSQLEKTAEMNTNIAVMIVNDLRRGASETDMLQRYGREWVYRRTYYIKCYRAIEYEEKIKRTDQNEDIVKMYLDNSIFSAEDVNKFYIMLDYLKSECITDFSSPLSFYLDNIDKNNVTGN